MQLRWNRPSSALKGKGRGMLKIVCVSLAVLSFSASAAPRLSVPPDGVAFGEIAAGEGSAKSIELRNVSSSPVAVSQVKGCCGAEASLSSMRIEPSGAATLSVSLKAILTAPLLAKPFAALPSLPDFP